MDEWVDKEMGKQIDKWVGRQFTHVNFYPFKYKTLKTELIFCILEDKGSPGPDSTPSPSLTQVTRCLSFDTLTKTRSTCPTKRISFTRDVGSPGLGLPRIENTRYTGIRGFVPINHPRREVHRSQKRCRYGLRSGVTRYTPLRRLELKYCLYT